MNITEPQPHSTRPGRSRGWKGIKYSKMVARRVADTKALRASIEVFKTQVAAGLGERLAPELAESETLPDFGLSLDLVGRSACSALDRLRAAERRCRERQIECAAVRRKSEKLARREVYPRVVSVRRLIEAQFGKQAGQHVHGMAGKTLRKAKRLRGQLEYLVWALEDGRDELPAPLLKGLATDCDVWLGELKPGYERLRELLDELLDLELSEQLARLEKNQAMQAFDAAYGEALRLTQATFAFAGHGDTLARMLRSYFQRRLLSRRARDKRQARAEGRVRQALRSTASSMFGWIGRRPSSVA